MRNFARKLIFRARRRQTGKAGSPPVRRAQGARRRVILFIGHHKVGSTSLQDFLSRNSVALAKAGILYPYVDFAGMSYLAAAAVGHSVLQGDILPPNIRVPHNALAFRHLAHNRPGKVPPWHPMLPSLDQMEHAIRQQLRFMDPHTVILAAEVFANFNAATPQSITRLADLFPDADFTILANLRRPDEYLASWQGQRLKFGHKMQPLRDDGFSAYFNGVHFDYRLMVEGWITRVPGARVILRDYADVCANGGSVRDFLAQTGLSMPGDLIPEQRWNTSFHRATYEILRRGNIDLPSDAVKHLHTMMRDLPNLVRLPPSNRIELFGSDNRQALVEKFTPIDAWLGQAAGRDGGFFGDLDRAREPLDIPEMEAHGLVLDGLRRQHQAESDPAIRDFLEALD